MSRSNYDVAIVGAGAAGATAAIALARTGFRVVLLEAATFPGAENWSGCVYFCENLADPEVLGSDGVEALAWERRVVERGFFATDGYGLLGMAYRDPMAFRHCYTVLRPVYDQHLALVAARHGAALLNETTAESLIRDDGRVAGVCTNRGPIYADIVFLAEGDASHLVTREGYEPSENGRGPPKFLQGIKQVIDLPPGAIEETFGVGPREGVAYEMLVRNVTLRGKPLRLNMGGFVYTNRQSLSVGLVLPADNLHDAFGGDPNLLMEWFEGLPALAPWLKLGQRGVFGAKLIRGGGAKDIPQLVDDGLAIGGAASAIGIDFPYPNFTGPATAMGLLLARAVGRIRAEGGTAGEPITREQLERHYLEPLRRTHYWRDVEFLRGWPGYVKRTRTFFERNVDLALASAYLWTRPQRTLMARWSSWVRMLLYLAGPGHWSELRDDLGHFSRALRVRQVVGRPSVGRLLIDGSMNAFRDVFARPRHGLPPGGTMRLHYSAGGGAEASAPAPALVRRWFRRFSPVVGAAARRVYANDATPLEEKLSQANGEMARQINLLDLLMVGLLGLAGIVTALLVVASAKIARLFRRGGAQAPAGAYRRYAEVAREATDLTPLVATAAQKWEARLGRLAYHTGKDSHIHVLWPRDLADKDQVAAKGLWRVCPAHVYEARISPLGQLQVVVNFENCIKCETCWRTSDLVDWGRDGIQRFVYPVTSLAMPRLLRDLDGATFVPAVPRVLDYWGAISRLDGPPPEGKRPANPNGEGRAAGRARLRLAQIERKLWEFEDALGTEPRTIDRGRAEYLELLARYVPALADRLQEDLESLVSAYGVCGEFTRLASNLALKAEERAGRSRDGRYSWAAADGRQIREHHVVGLRRHLDALGENASLAPDAIALSRRWLQAEESQAKMLRQVGQWTARLDAVLPAGFWRELENQVALTPEQDAVMRGLLAEVPGLDLSNRANSLHPPMRKALLAELARRDPSLAYRAASHLWARDLAGRSADGELTAACARWARGDEWACLALLRDPEAEALFVPALGAKSVLVLAGTQLTIVEAGDPALRVEPLATLGLRGAGLAAVRMLDARASGIARVVDRDEFHRIWSVVSAADLCSIATGMAGLLCERAVAHATGRVQFPGLFHDEEARDTIGKFGAVKKMVADMGARRYLIETLDHDLSPADFSNSSVRKSGLVKALVAEALGTAPGSLSYNAGQIFGGTGYSEDDVLAKFYRDASAWRFLGPPNPDVWAQHGREIRESSRGTDQGLDWQPNQTQLFDEITQRQALQPELNELRGVRSRLEKAQGSWHKGRDQSRDVAAGIGLAEMAEALARLDAQQMGATALVLRTHARLEHGLPAEVEIALVRVWLELVSASMDELEFCLQQAGSALPASRPGGERWEKSTADTYAALLATPLPYQSGDFLAAPVDLTQPRYVPEMVVADPDLAAADRKYRDLLRGHFKSRDGVPYERYIERQHRPDAADLDFCRLNGFFRMPIPKQVGGLDALKAHYYLLTTNAQRFVDVAISLTIQANTSIGTTPVLLARAKDLPSARKDLAAFIGDTGLHAGVIARVEELIRLLDAADPGAIEKGYLTLQRDVGKSVLSRPVLRVLARRFADRWQQAAQAGLGFDVATMRVHLQESLSSWKEEIARASEFHGELIRRQEGCDLFLRWVSAGQISAFALTEPSAGSDTARVATRARARSAPVEVEPDGALRFVPEGARTSRYLLDARRLHFRDNIAYYRWSERAEPALIQFDEYDYETDDPARMRYYLHGKRRVDFTDVAQLRERDGRLWYDYWELTGAKMWITNGRMCGIMSLYAKTEEGVTGFTVDRHAEGLVVGKDEAKLGQLGSPTNELSLQAVRVPRENVIGLEGRGQVNALETLNVGRAGLAMSAVAQMRGLIDSSRSFLESNGEDVDGIAWRVRRMEEECFIAEAVAYEVIGRFEHPQTKSVRMESAIAKTLASELLHHIIELAEEVHGLEGQTERHLVEKRKRDARILNIYEGTNEVQRFTILKDLVAEAAPRWSRKEPPLPQQGQRAKELEGLKEAVRQRVHAAIAIFGQGIWQNPNLQANCFLLAEAAMWLKAADSTLGRLAWVARHTPTGELECSQALVLASAALARCHAETQDRLHRFDQELTRLRRGSYAPAVRAAALLFRQGAASQPVQEGVAGARRSSIERPFRILVVVEPGPGPLPELHVADGRLLEPHLTLGEAGRSALETALRLRDESGAPVTVEVVAVGSRAAVPCLREAFSLGVDRIRLVVPPTHAVTADSAAAALVVLTRGGPAFDLVLGGEASPGQEGVSHLLLAAGLRVPYAGAAAGVAVRADLGESSVLLSGEDGEELAVRPLPAAVGIRPGVRLRQFRVEGYYAGLAKAVEQEDWAESVPARPVSLEAGMLAEEVRRIAEPTDSLTPGQAAARFLDAVGKRGRQTATTPCQGPINDVETSALLKPPQGAPGIVTAVLAPDASGQLRLGVGALLDAAREVAGALACEMRVVLLCPADEQTQRRLLGQLQERYAGTVVLLVAGSAGNSDQVSARILEECWPLLPMPPRAVVAEAWAEGSLASLAFRNGGNVVVALRVRRWAVRANDVFLETSRERGKLHLLQRLDSADKGTVWISMISDAEMTEAAGAPSRLERVERWSPRLEGFFGRADVQLLLGQLKKEAGITRLADADFIVDVGYGVHNRDGYEAVIEPLESALRSLGVRSLVVGGSRKVTEELHLLPADRQIGQSGVSVHPRVLLAIGISGAPQHLDYIGRRTTILAFNRDSEAPVMTLNQRQPRPRVLAVVGDLFETVPAFTAALLELESCPLESEFRETVALASP